MKVFRILGKSIREAFKSIFRNFSLSVASISCTTITLIIVAIALLATYNVNSITKEIEDVLTIVVFVDKKATEDEIKELSNKIYATDNVDKDNTVYNSKEKLKEDLSQDEKMKVLLDTVDENPLQATFVVKVTDVKHLTETAEKFKTYDKVANVKYGESLVNKLLRVFSIIRNGCVVAVVALILVTAFLIANTIKITIFSRRTEIGIMRLVGTSNTVIKLPFLIEGFVLGVIGSIIPILLTIYGYTFLYDYSGGNLFTELVVLVKPAEIVYSSSLVLLIVGGVVGMFGSVRAVRKFLKV
jgi:cell division transport system permease protein